MLIFELDAAQDRTRVRRTNVRLIGAARGDLEDSIEQFHESGHAEGHVSAVLIIRALTPSRLLSCVRAATHGATTAQPEMLAQLGAETRRDNPTTGLTTREIAVLRMLADGDGTRDIAGQLNYSERTVKNIVHDLLAKLSCRTRAQAVALATRRGLI